MGKGGKSKGKMVFSLIGLAVGAFAFQWGVIGAIQGGLIGASVGSTIWTVTHKQNPYGNLDSDYSQDDYSRFNTVTNDVNQNAVIPVIYGTRKYGGLQTYHNTYNGSRYLQKDVILCEAGIEGIYNVCANEELIKSDTNISIYNTQYPNATVTRTSKGNLRLSTGVLAPQDYKLGDVDNYDAQSSLLTTVIDKIKSEAGNGWKIDGAVDDRTSKGISANSMQFNSSTPVKCYVDNEDIQRKGAVVLDNRGYKIGEYKFYQNVAPDNYMEVGGYPQCAWIRSDLVASSRLSGSNPTINAFIKGMKVPVFDGNTWVLKYTENPAWIIRDFLINTRYGTGHWITEDMLDDESFKEVADYCDYEIEYTDFDGTKKKCPRYKLNIILDTQKTPLEHLSSMLAVFGGFITFGKRISLKVEKSESPVYAFTDETIVKDSLSIAQTSLSETPNRYKIGYFDPAQSWTEVKVIVEDLELQHEQDGQINEKVISLAGCTSQNQALRLGRLYRDLNKVCSLTISFSVATQGMMLECGDVITVSYGGIFKDMPFRITEIQETNSGIYQLSCRQYNPTIYNDGLGSTIVNPNYVVIDSPYTNNIPTVRNLIASERSWTNADGGLNVGMVLNWDNIFYQFFDHYQIGISYDGTNYTTIKSCFENTCYINSLRVGYLWVSVQVITKDGLQGLPAITMIDLKGKDELPPNVSLLDNDLLPNGIRRFWWEFDYPNPNDIVGFKLKYTQGNNADWENAIDLHSGVVTEQPFETLALRDGTHTVMIKAVDNAGNESDTPAIAVLNLGDTIEENVLWTDDLAENNWSKVTHNGIVKSDGSLEGYDIDKPLVISCRFQPLTGGQLWLQHNATTKTEIKYCVGSGSLAWTGSEKDKYWKNEGKLQWSFNNMYKPYTGRVMVNSIDSFNFILTITPEKGQVATISSLKALIDVPDCSETFNNITIPVEGLNLPIKTPNYFTTAVRCNSLQTDIDGQYEMEVVSRTPCIIRFNKLNNDASFSKTPIEVTADITWQGFQKEVI